MNKRLPSISTNKLKRSIDLIFLILVITVMALLYAYWHYIMIPHVEKEAQQNAKALSYAYSQNLSVTLTSMKTKSISSELIHSLSSILTFRDAKTGIQFILGIELKLDEDAFQIDKEIIKNKLKKGNLNCKECFIVTIPIFSTNTQELLGVVTFHTNGEFLKRQKKNLKSKLAPLASIGLVLFFLLWIILNRRINSIRAENSKLRKKYAQMAHTGRLTAMGEMATGIAHEINQPLAIILLATERLIKYFETRSNNNVEAAMTSRIMNQVNRANTIIKNMRSFARAKSDTTKLINLVEPTAAALSFFKEQFRIHEINLDFDFADDLPEIRLDPQKFEQIIVNLLSNARYAVEKREGGQLTDSEYQKRVYVRLFQSDSLNDIILEVEDNGVGMTNEDLDHCFDPFYTNKEVNQGTGLGLAIVNNIARESKMRLEIETIEGSLTIFRILIPISD